MRQKLKSIRNVFTFKKPQLSKQTLSYTENSFKESEIMKGVNVYHRNLSKEEIEAGLHREFIGGMWEEIGKLQFEFLKQNGLRPEHNVLDVGCGSMRGGLWFVNYLDSTNYAGLDINESLIEAGRIELEKANLMVKEPALLVNNQFEFWKFEKKFDFAVAISVFTHLNFNYILRCLIEVKKVMRPDSKFYATFFEAPSPVYLEPILHERGGIQTCFDKDPFHISLLEVKSLANLSGLKVEYIGEWNHPRNQKMLCFTL